MNTFEQQYLQVRQQEQRLYSDEEVKVLPNVDPSHIHYREWQFRKRSANKLVSYLQKKNAPLNILEVGCGNGWLSAKLARNAGFTVTGTDINMVELSQAIRLFGDRPVLKFICGDIRNNIFPPSTFDIIIFAASIQYFQSFSATMDLGSSLLKPGGEVHILDTHFYPENKIVAARERTSSYYNQEGVPGMARHYFHHTIDEVRKFEHRVLGGNNLIAKALRMNSGLKWIRIKGTRNKAQGTSKLQGTRKTRFT